MLGKDLKLSWQLEWQSTQARAGLLLATHFSPCHVEQLCALDLPWARSPQIHEWMLFPTSLLQLGTLMQEWPSGVPVISFEAEFYGVKLVAEHLDCSHSSKGFICSEVNKSIILVLCFGSSYLQINFSNISKALEHLLMYLKLLPVTGSVLIGSLLGPRVSLTLLPPIATPFTLLTVAVRYLNTLISWYFAIYVKLWKHSL